MSTSVLAQDTEPQMPPDCQASVAWECVREWMNEQQKPWKVLLYINVAIYCNSFLDFFQIQIQEQLLTVWLISDDMILGGKRNV